MRLYASLVAVVLAGSVSGGCGSAADRSPVPPAPSGWVLYQLGDRSVHLVAAVPHGAGLDLSKRLAANGPAALSLDGRYVAVTTADGCAALSTGEFTRLEKVTAGGRCAAQYAESFAVSSDGGTLIFTSGGGPHRRDVFLVHRDGPDRWTGPRNLTASGHYQVNKQPILAPDGGTVAFDCSDGDASDEGTSVCQAPTSGTGPVSTVLAAPVGTGEQAWTAFHSPAYLPDGGYAVECHHPHEELVCRSPAGGGTPVRVTAEGLSNDNSPCAFADGRIASLLDTGIHTIRVTAPDGSGGFTAFDAADVLDAGISCGGG